MKSVLQVSRAEMMKDFFDRCRPFHTFDEDRITYLTNQTIKFINASAEERKTIQVNIDLEKRWYDSLLTGVPDYSVYAEDDYIAELLACWFIYSKRYVYDIRKENSMANSSVADYLRPVNMIVDLGCGFGYTSAAFREIYTEARVIGTNMKDTLQYKVAVEMGKQFGFNMVSDAAEIQEPVDLVFASEYFEHFEAPIEHLHYITETLKPRAWLIANAFGPHAIGHFNYYKVGNEVFEAKTTGKIFNETMKKLGYSKIQTKLWNNRPALWAKNTDSGLSEFLK